MINPNQIYFSGDYSSWTTALKECEIHPTEPVHEKVLAATLKIRATEAVQEGVFSGRSSCNFALITALLSVALKSRSHLKVLDFGGSIGISYFHSRRFLGALPEITWSVVELPELGPLAKSILLPRNSIFTTQSKNA
jgi:putative methyltransferase (TIGR04325 family)